MLLYQSALKLLLTGLIIRMRLLAPSYYLESKVSGTGSLSFDYDTDNKVVYFGCSVSIAIFIFYYVYCKNKAISSIFSITLKVRLI